jgi:parallel beta-helix repeat protein
VLLSRIAQNDLDGVGIVSSNDNEVAFNEFVGNAIAVNVNTANGNRIALNRIVDPRFGNAITMSGVSHTHVIGNSIQNGGMNLNSMTESRIEWNRIAGAVVSGYSIRGQSSNNVLAYNGARGVSGDGFSVFGISPVFGPTQNTLIGNWASGNTGDGFDMSGATSANTLRGNVSEGNGGFGFRDATSGGGTAGTANVYDRNLCQNNVSGASTPPELCRDLGGG